MTIKKILELVAQGKISVENALKELRDFPYKKLKEGICLDSHREVRTGQKEVVFGKGKSLTQLITIVSSFPGEEILITKISKEIGIKLQNTFESGTFFEVPGLFVKGKKIELSPPWKEEGEVIIITAGAADLPVALEAYGCAKFFDLNVGIILDVGVAGIHRIFPYLDILDNAKLLIVVAGMEGALPSVVSGITGKPILAVPTSIGYGANLNGISALLGMLNSCAGGIAVLNIDNGFGAALMAARILQSCNLINSRT